MRTRKDILKSPEYWITKIQIALYDCAEKFMKKTNRNRTELASYLGVSKGYVSQVLNGDYDHRISKLVEMSLQFGYVPRISFTPVEEVMIEDEHRYQNTITVTGDMWDVSLKREKEDKHLKIAA